MKMENENNLEPSGEFATSIRDFRSAVTHVTLRETARPVTAGWLAPAQQRRRSAQHKMVLGWACAALLCLATLPLSIRSHHAAVKPAVTAATAPAIDSDTALLEQVDTDLSESVPSSLAPLADLDSSTADANTSGDPSANGSTPTHTESTNVAQ